VAPDLPLNFQGNLHNRSHSALTAARARYLAEARALPVVPLGSLHPADFRNPNGSQAMRRHVRRMSVPGEEDDLVGPSRWPLRRAYDPSVPRLGADSHGTGPAGSPRVIAKGHTGGALVMAVQPPAVPIPS